MKLSAWMMSLALVLVCQKSFAADGGLGKAVEYKQGETTLEGYVAEPKKKSLGAVLIVHDWMGVGDFVKKKADQLAAMGYVALAVDIYGKGQRPANAEEAGKFATQYKNDRALLRKRVQAGLDELKKIKGVEAKKIVAIGYCFGGTTVLELARAGASVAGVVSFHGGLDTPNPQDAKNIKSKILVLHGADDPFVPEKDVKGIEDEMKAAHTDWQLIKYSGAVHSFTNPAAGKDNSKGAAYNELADKRSWEAMKVFFSEIL